MWLEESLIDPDMRATYEEEKAKLLEEQVHPEQQKIAPVCVRCFEHSPTLQNVRPGTGPEELVCSSCMTSLEALYLEELSANPIEVLKVGEFTQGLAGAVDEFNKLGPGKLGERAPPFRADQPDPCDERKKDFSKVDAAGTSGVVGDFNELYKAAANPSNPKQAMGSKKVPFFSVLPPSGLIHMAMVMKYGAYDAKRKDGTTGYGPFNWRESAVEYNTYLDAIVRHLLALVDGEDTAADSKQHHAAHIGACCLIILDAIECDVLIDNRPPPGNASELLELLKEQI